MLNDKKPKVFLAALEVLLKVVVEFGPKLVDSNKLTAALCKCFDAKDGKTRDKVRACTSACCLACNSRLLNCWPTAIVTHFVEFFPSFPSSSCAQSLTILPKYPSFVPRHRVNVLCRPGRSFLSWHAARAAGKRCCPRWTRAQ